MGAKIEFDSASLQPLVEQIVEAVIKALDARLDDLVDQRRTATDRMYGKKLTIAEVAKLCGCPPQSIRCWISRGQHDFPPGFKIGKRRLFLESDIAAWLEGRPVHS